MQPYEKNAFLDTLYNQGAALIPQALLASLCQDAWAFCQSGFERADTAYSQGEMSTYNYETLYRYGHISQRDLPELAQWFPAILSQATIQDFLRAYFGSHAYLLFDNTLPRRQSGIYPQRAIPWHQDCEFMGPMQRAVTLWIPLTPAGGEWPGLELFLQADSKPLFEPSQSVLQREQVINTQMGKRWKPQLQPGDILVFTPFTLHRTCLGESKQTRLSFELRLISESDTPLTRSPLVRCDF